MIPYADLSKQRGAALVVVLILLLLMTLLGLASLRGTLLEERMSANLLDRSLSFQSAEAALRIGETVALGSPVFPGAVCAGGLCPAPIAGAPDRWLNPAFGGWIDAVIGLGAAAVTPQYFIEDLGLGETMLLCGRVDPPDATCFARTYRVTARSVAADRAQVILQSNFAP